MVDATRWNTVDKLACLFASAVEPDSCQAAGQTSWGIRNGLTSKKKKQESNSIPPIVIDLNKDGKIELIQLKDSKVYYNMDGTGDLKNTGWVSKYDGLLVIDINEDSYINLPKEISFKLWHTNATTDLEGFKLFFDYNKDCVVDEKDPFYQKLLVWQDYNQNGISEPEELKNMSSTGIKSFLVCEIFPIENTNHMTKALSQIPVKYHDGLVGAAYDVVLEYEA